MLGIACIFISSVLFIHLGLGEAISKILNTSFVLFRCVKCLTFWCTLSYSLFHLSVVYSICIAFVLSYASIWMELLLGIIAKKYEEYSKDVDAEESKSD